MGRIWVLMGVSGSGKSTIGRGLSVRTGIRFFDGDDIHPESNLIKMKKGIPLNDKDREPWLRRLNEVAKESLGYGGCIIACSALKKAYRTLLTREIESEVTIFWLKGDPDTIRHRMEKRRHFMPPSMLDSQLSILEEPVNAVVLDIEKSPAYLIKTIIHRMNSPEFGIAGMGVMGKSVARNFAQKGFKLALYNRHVPKVEEKVAAKTISAFPELTTSLGFDDTKQFVKSLVRPRKILLMVEAGKAVDELLAAILPHMQQGDIVMDGGNSHYDDTERRIALCDKKGVHFLGCGISGGEKGALEGPAIMPGGNKGAYELVRPYLESIAARKHDTEPCCAYIAAGGAGHYVKMVHNGIEYAEMQLIAEVYGILRYVSRLDPGQIGNVFQKWAKKKNSAYLLEISAEILKTKWDGNWIIDKIHDSAGSKGTGGWAALDGIQRGHAFTTMTAALFSRFISSDWKWRKYVSEEMKFKPRHKAEKPELKDLEDALYAARIINHHLGFELIRKAAEEKRWEIDLAALAGIWTNGCIIRSSLMVKIADHLKGSPHLMADPLILQKLKKHRKSLIGAVQRGLEAGLDVSVMSAAANYLNAVGQYPGTTSLIQAQRDFFGAHTFRWMDNPDGKAVHFHWQQ